jgi:hypothetical protein
MGHNGLVGAAGRREGPQHRPDSPLWHALDRRVVGEASTNRSGCRRNSAKR